jgi:hypothetical protein
MRLGFVRHFRLQGWERRLMITTTKPKCYHGDQRLPDNMKDTVIPLASTFKDNFKLVGCTVMKTATPRELQALSTGIFNS